MNILLNRKRVRKVSAYYNSDKGIRNIPYSLGSWLIDWFCSTKYAREEFFRKKTPILKEFIAHFPGKYDEKQTTIRFLSANFLHGWKGASFSNLPKKKYRKKLKITGYDIFKDEYNKGKGVVLVNSHFGHPAVVMSMFPALGYKNFKAVVGENFSASMKYKILRKERVPEIIAFERGGQSGSFKQLFESRDLLDKGGILHILGDGMHGVANHFINFLGKPRGFRSSFAELSLMSGAPIVTVFAYPGKRGNMHIVFEGPLDTGPEKMEHEDRVRMILSQYADILEKKWMEHPYFITGGYMGMYNKQVQIPEK